MNLSTAPGTPAFSALAISDNGGVIYGQNQTNPNGGLPPETRVPIRYEPGIGANLVDLTPTGKTWGYPVPRGTSANGLVMVGAASTGAVTGATTGVAPNQIFTTIAIAFRYLHNAGLLRGPRR